MRCARTVSPCAQWHIHYGPRKLVLVRSSFALASASLLSESFSLISRLQVGVRFETGILAASTVLKPHWRFEVYHDGGRCNFYSKRVLKLEHSVIFDPDAS